MLDLYLLQQFVTFKECGSLNLAAEKLCISQPALSKSMKKLEDDIGYPLFIRSNRKIALNKTGEYLANKAKDYLKSGEDLLLEVNEYNRSLNNISVGSCAPAPLWELNADISLKFKDISITSRLSNNNELLKGLANNTYQLIIINKEINDDNLYVKKYRDETLYISVPKTHRLYKRKYVTPKDLKDELALVYKDIGEWMDWVKENMPDLHLMVLDDMNALNNAVRLGMTLSFVTDTDKDDRLKENKILPIKGIDSSMHFYLVCKKDNLKRFKSITN